MNLSDMASFVCGKVRHTEANDLAACKQFIRQRYEVIYHDQLWKHTVMQLDIAVDPAAIVYGALSGAGIDMACNRDGVVLLPPIIDRVLAVRTSDRAVEVSEAVDWFRVDHDEFTATGDPVGFIEQSRVVWCPAAPANPVEERNVTCSFNSDLVPSDTGQHVAVRLIDKNGIRQSYDLTLGAGANDPFSGPVLSIESFSKPVTNGPILLIATDTVVATLPATETEFRPLARIRLMPKPRTALTIKVLFKLRHVPLANDQESPLLLGIENTLLALAQGDMLERERQYAKASAKYQEGIALLEQFKRVETVQQANRTRLQPVGENEGYVSDLPTKGFW